MRRRGLGILVSLVALGLSLVARPAAAQTPSTDGEAVGELLGGDGAGVVTSHEQFQPAPSNSGGGSGPDEWTCIRKGTASNAAPLEDFSTDKVESDYQAALAVGQQTIQVELLCTNNITGQVVATNYTYPPQGGAPVDPRVLAETARNRLTYPAPSGNTTPPMDPGTVAQLPTYFYVDNFEPVTASATAGPVTATVTATPTHQRWEIRDSVRDTTDTVECDGPGVAYDPTSGAAPPAGVCSWTPSHSSAGQSAESPQSGEPCFETTVTITWSVSWDSNVGAGGDLGEGTSSSTACLVVAEVQAVVTETQ